MAVDMFLKLDGIPGESKDGFHKNWIEIESFSWGASSTGAGSGGGGGAGKVSLNDLTFVQAANKASPKLMEACAEGRHLKDATLSLRKSGGKQEPYLTYKLSDVLVSSFQTGGSGSDVRPMEELALNFGRVSVSYTDASGETTAADCGGEPPRD